MSAAEKIMKKSCGSKARSTRGFPKPKATCSKSMTRTCFSVERDGFYGAPFDKKLALDKQ